MKYKRILVAVDGSETSDLALQEAIDLTRDQKCNLRIIHILDEAIVKYAETYIDYKTLWALYKKEGQDLIERINKQLTHENIDFSADLVVLKVNKGRLAEKIAAEAKKWHADLLVIGTHGRQGISHFFLGSVAERVLRLTSMPVLLIRGQQQ